MSLTLLPNELLEIVITHVLPEGFESLAMSCKKFHALCVPFIKQHNAFQSRFRHFAYYENTEDRTPITSAFDLITRIADEPRIAHYIRSADFKIDGLSKYAKNNHKTDAVMKLFANSLYLEQAGLDWQIYYAKMEEDLQAARYSQHAAAFLLTLLFNVEHLCLPKKWKPNDATNKLINTVVRKAQESYFHEAPQSHFHGNRSSLTRIKKLETSVSLGPREHCNLNWAYLFLALPRIQSFRGPSCVSIHDDEQTNINNRHNGFTTTLETVHFENCCIDESDIAEFLKHSPHLKTLRYSHSTKEIVGNRDWKICEFVTTIKRETGNHLEGLSISMREFRGSIVSDRISMSGFQRLQKLELPLEIANFARHKTIENESFIDDFIPASVSQLSLISDGSNDHAKILKSVFQAFTLRKKELALKRIFLTCPVNATDAYKEQCTRLRAETKKTDVILEIRSYPTFTTIAWDEKDELIIM